MSLGNSYWVALVVMALDVVIGGAVCKALNISPSTSYALGFASVFAIFLLLMFIDIWTDRRPKQ